MTSRIGAEVVFPAAAALGEGALWDVATERLYWVDIVGHKACCFDPKAQSNLAYDVGEDVGTVVLARNGKWVVALRSGVAVLDPATGSVTPLVTPEVDRRGNRLNDGKCDPRGRLWVGSMVESGPRGDAALYSIDLDLKVEKKLSHIDLSNGLVWARDERLFYHIDTPTQRVRAFDYDVATGAISGERAVFELPKAAGSPDGMTIDENDQLWVALWGGRKVLRVDPKSGGVGFEVDVPVDRVTSCAFGGSDLDTLYITTARIGAGPEELAKQPLAGSLFAARVPFRGVPSRRFARDV
jgi:sugar lactone lactonase YvrE